MFVSRSSLLLAASSLLTACLSESDTEGSNYFVDVFEGGVSFLPYPVDMCVATGLQASYAMYSCSSDGSSVTKTTYIDATCQTSSGDDALEYTSHNVTDLGLYDFNCDGMDNYASIILCLSAAQDTETGEFDCGDCPLRVESLQATDVCFNGGATASYASVTIECDADSVDVFYYHPFENPTCDSNVSAPLAHNSAGSDCTAFTAVDGLIIYWTFVSCSDVDALTSTTLEPIFSLDCQEIFGDTCLECDNNGCTQCMSGYRRVSAGTSNVYVCVEDDLECDVGVDRCVYSNCGDAFENSNCASFTSWGCTECQDGYFKRSHQYPCVSCGTIAGCVECSDFAGCLRCENGMFKYWDPDCGLNRCSNTCVVQ